MLSMRRELAVDGPRDPDDVWDRYVRPARWPEWSPQIRSVDYAGKRLVAGASGVVHGLGGVRVPFRVLDVDEISDVRNWAWAASVLGAELVLGHAVEPFRHGGGVGTRTRLTVRGPAPLVAAYLPAARWALHRLVT